MQIEPSTVRDYKVINGQVVPGAIGGAIVNGVIEIPLNQRYSHHSISIEGVSGSVKLETMPNGLTSYREFDGNSLTENSTAVFVLGSQESMRFTPAQVANNYTIAVSSF